MTTAIQHLAPALDAEVSAAPLLSLAGLEDELPDPRRADRIAEELRRAAGLRNQQGADLLAAAADRPALAHWTTSDGVDLRTLAVELLVDMGHPFALAVPPEALEAAWRKPGGRRRRRFAKACAIVGGICAGGAFGFSSPGLKATVGAVVVAAMVGAGLMRAEALERSERKVGYGLLATLAGVIGLFGATLHDDGLVSATAITAALLFGTSLLTYLIAPPPTDPRR